MARIATVEELAPVANIANLGNVNLDQLQADLDAAEMFAERYTGRLFSPDPVLDEDGEDTGSPVSRTFGVRSKRVIKVPDIREAVTVTLDGVTLSEPLGYYLDAAGETSRQLTLVRMPVPGSAGSLVVVGRWGMLTTPVDMKRAILRLAARWYRQKETMYADVMETDAGAFAWRSELPSDIRGIFDRYRDRHFALV